MRTKSLTGSRKKRINKLIQLQRRKQIAELLVEGLSHRKIAEQIGISVSQLNIDLAKIKKQWREETTMSYEDSVATELMRLNDVEYKARQSYELSCQVWMRVDKKWVLNTERRQKGDPSFLEQIRKCIELRLKLTGALKPADINLTQNLNVFDVISGALPDSEEDTKNLLEDKIEQRLLKEEGIQDAEVIPNDKREEEEMEGISKEDETDDDEDGEEIYLNGMDESDEEE